MKTLTMMLCLWAGAICAQAQIGYQISLLNTATGEPRANETVTVTVSLSNSAGEVFYSETKSATTNDFGVLSLSVGNADTFKEVDLTKMPFYIEASANGVMIGKSQILSVPVAEVAKRLAPTLTEELCGKPWIIGRHPQNTMIFSEDGTCRHVESGMEGYVRTGTYKIEGNAVYVLYSSSDYLRTFYFYNGLLYKCN